MRGDPFTPIPPLVPVAGKQQATPNRPWLGLAHFTEADRDYFYGRDAEVRELTDRVRRAPLTVLYGVSGYGKSSILGAGLIPELRAAGHPIALLRRCYDDLVLRPLHADVMAACAAAISGCREPEDPNAVSLWEFFHDRGQPWFQHADRKRDTEADDAPDTAPWPVLILDQFEEIFTKGEDSATGDPVADARTREAARSFLTQLADLVENRPPEALRERLRSGRSEERRALVSLFDFQTRPVRVALAVRDDFLGRLERWRRAMPSLMEHRVELRLLSGPQALNAVFEPGTKRPGQPPILQKDVAAAIVRAAAGAAPDVPLEEIDAVPPILSLLCERLNDRRLAASPPPTGITASDFSPGEAERILGRFYDDKLRDHPRALREYIEDKLVSDSGFRENLNFGSALAALRAVVPDVERRLRQLVDDRVLVIEDRGGIPRVELTHDTLARLALDRRAERNARARRLKAIAWSVTSLTIAGVSLALTFWALRAKATAVSATKEAEKQTVIARDRATEAEQEKVRALGLIRFMDAQIGQAFVNEVPLQLRERVSARVDAYYTERGTLATLEDHERMGYHIRKAMVHFAAVSHYQGNKDHVTDEWKNQNINWEVESAEVSLKEAMLLGERLAVKFPDDREITRDRILTHYHLATLATLFKDAYRAGEHLRAAREVLDGIVKAGPFSLIHWMDWMDLPNLDAAMGDWVADSGDKADARDWYRKAIDIETLVLARRPDDKERKDEIERIKKCLQEITQ